MTDINIMSLNCRGLHGVKKRLMVFQHLKSLKYNIYCIQDTHFTKDMYKTIYSQWGSEVFMSYNSSNSRGVAILFQNSDHTINDKIYDKNGNYVILDLTIDEHRFTLVSVYGPNTDRPEFYENIFNAIELIGNDSYMICGDFNLVLDPEIDYHNYKHINNKKSRDAVLKYIQTQDLCDPYRERNPEKRGILGENINPCNKRD